jgi:hypothetical protein
MPGGSASAVVSMVRTTPPKEDKVDTLSTEAPMAQALVARSESKASNDNLVDDDPDLLKFDVAESEIVCWMNSWLQRCWPVPGKPDYLIWYFEWFGFHDP